MKYSFLLIICVCIAPSLLFANGASETEEPEQYTIGFSKIVAHPALDALEKGVQDELSEQGVSAQYDSQNANGDINAAISIAQKFSSDSVDLAVGIATPTAQALVQVLEDTPVVYTGVTDPVAAGIVSSYDRGETNVTGVSDKTPVEAQLQLLKELLPNMSILGHVYTGSEENAVLLAKEAEAVSEKMGLEFVSTTVTNSSEVRSAAESIISRVDAIYVSTDNTVVSALPSIIEVAENNDVPILSADPSSAKDGGVLVAWGFDYYKMGRATGRIVIDILVNGVSPAEIPTQYMVKPSDIELLINTKVAETLGITIPTPLLNEAEIIEK